MSVNVIIIPRESVVHNNFPSFERLIVKGKKAYNGLTAIALNFHSLLSSGSVLGLVVKTLSLADALHDQDL